MSQKHLQSPRTQRWVYKRYIVSSKAWESPWKEIWHRMKTWTLWLTTEFEQSLVLARFSWDWGNLKVKRRRVTPLARGQEWSGNTLVPLWCRSASWLCSCPGNPYVAETSTVDGSCVSDDDVSLDFGVRGSLHLQPIVLFILPLLGDSSEVGRLAVHLILFFVCEQGRRFIREVSLESVMTKLARCSFY